MKKHRNILKYFITIVQTFILALPLTSLVFNAVFHHLGLFNLSQSVSGNQEASISETTFISEDNNINNYALKSLYDFNYLNTGNEITTYEYTEAYPTNELSTYEDIVEDNYYYLFFSDEGLVTCTFDVEIIFYRLIYANDVSAVTFLQMSSDLEGQVTSTISLNSQDMEVYFNIDGEYGEFYLSESALNLLVRFVNPPLENTNFQNYINNQIELYNLVPFDYPLYTQTETTTTIVDIPSFIEATDGLTYDEIIDNNYVNTHLLLNLDIVGLFTNNLSGNIYIMLWLNYFLNYILTFMVVFLAFDVILYFIFIIRKILDRSVEYTDRREF